MLGLAFASLYLVVFGVLTAVGGLVGFVKARSKASLIAGSVAGGALVFAGLTCRSADSARLGLVIGLLVSVALAGRFGLGFAKSRKVMPAGLMAALGLGGVAATALALSGT